MSRSRNYIVWKMSKKSSLLEMLEGIPMIKCLISGNHLVYGLYSSVWLIRNRYNILIDTSAFSCREKLLHALAEHDLTPAKIDGVVYTHLHMDHCWNQDLFPGTPVFVSEFERESMKGFLTRITENPGSFGDEMRQALGFQDIPSMLMNHLSRFFYQDRIPEHILSGRSLKNEDLAELGLIPFPTPGHTAGHTSFIYETEGTSYCFSGDALMNRESYRNPRLNMLFNEDLARYYESKKILEERNGWFCPGHGDEFPALEGL